MLLWANYGRGIGNEKKIPVSPCVHVLLCHIAFLENSLIGICRHLMYNSRRTQKNNTFVNTDVISKKTPQMQFACFVNATCES